MNRGYSYTPRVHARSPPRRDKVQTQDTSRTSRLRQQASMKQDINIDDFGDMGSDEDDFQALGRSFMPPKPPAQPQYNLVPYGFLRDDDELGEEEDYDGIPIDDAALPGSPKKQPWQSSLGLPHSEEIRGDPITVLDSGNRPNTHLSKRPNDIRSQDVTSRNRPGLGSSSLGNYISKVGDSCQLGGSDRWAKKGESFSYISSGNRKNVPSSMGIDHSVGKAQSFARNLGGANPLIQSGQTLSQGFVCDADDSNHFMKTNNKSSSSEKAMGFIRSTDDSNPFIKGGNKPPSFGNTTPFVSARDTSSTSLRSHDNSLRWNDKTKPAQKNTPNSRQDQDRGFPQSLKEQVPSGQLFTPTNDTSSQLEMIQAAALQQALAGLTQLGSQSGLNLLGAQKLLMQASQNPTLAAALVASGGMLNTGLSSIQPNTPNNPTVEALLKSVPTAAPDIPQTNLGLLTYPLRSNVKANPGSTPHKSVIPDGSGSTRYPAPDVTSLVFDPSTGYRFDSSTGLHYDANSGYFFNSELKRYLRWDKFTQTYLKVDNPPGVPHFINSSRMSYMTDSSVVSQNTVLQQPSISSNTSLSKGSDRSSNNFSSSSFTKESLHGLNKLIDVPTSSFQKQINAVQSSISTIPIDFSKPPPLPHTPHMDPGFQYTRANLSGTAEQKVAVLPNYAETSLFNKLRKAKLAQTAQAKSDRKWGSPDPLLEAVQKHATETDKSHGDVLNLKEILQRSRQFMQLQSGNSLQADDSSDRPTGKDKSQSGDLRKFRSRSRSAGRSLRRSRSTERAGIRRGKPSMSPQRRRPSVRSPDSSLRGRPNSRGRSPCSRGYRRSTPSPARHRMSASRSKSPSNRRRDSLSPESKRRKSASMGRSPINRARDRASPSRSPEARKKRRASRGRSLSRRKRNSSKSPGPRKGRPISKDKSSERAHVLRSTSQELRKKHHHHHHHHTRDRSLQRSQSPKVKVVDQSPGRSKLRTSSPPLQGSKRLAGRGLSAERSKLRRKLSPVNIESPERMGSCAEDKTAHVGGKPMKERLGVHENRKESLEKDKTTELKPIPYDTPQNSSKKLSDKGKDVSGYKSLSNLRKQGKDKPRDKEAEIKQNNSQQNKYEPAASKPTPSTEIDLTVDSDDERHSRANQRLVSERTFSSSWERKKPDSVSPRLSTKKIDAKAESRLQAKDTKDCIDPRDAVNIYEIEEDAQQLEEPNEFDFLTETLDDDKESTVIDEYEEILDYQDLDETTELEENEPASTHAKPDTPGATKSLSKESIGSPVIDLFIDSGEPVIGASESESHVESTQTGSVLIQYPSGKPGHSDDTATIVAQDEGADVTKNKELGYEEVGDVESHDLRVDSKSLDNSARVSDPQSLKDSCVGMKQVRKPDAPLQEVHEKGGPTRAQDVPIVQTGTSEVEPETTEDGKGSKEVDKAASEINIVPNNNGDHSEHNRLSSDDLEPELLNNDEWNVVDSVDDQEELTKPTTCTDDYPGSVTQDVMELDPTETDETSMKQGVSIVQKVKGGSYVTQSTPSTKSQDDRLNFRVEKDKPDPKASEGGVKDKEIDPQVGKGGGHYKKPDSEVIKEDGTNDKPPVRRSEDDGPSKEISSQREAEEPVLQVRSVSDIEKFLLLSSQEVEAKREQGIEPAASKNEKKSGIFSRLGEKLPKDEARDDPKLVLELPAETLVSTDSPSKKAPGSAPLKSKAGAAKLSGASSSKKKPTKNDIVDPVGNLFHDSKPTSQILIGPMNFIEPFQNFQQFTQKYMQRLLRHEGVKFRQVYVCHEDVTGAPYHYILVMFHTVGAASEYFSKQNGRFKCNAKLFSQIPGNTKHKLIPSAEAFVHYTENNWVCKVCKKGNFPPRSLCFGCFQHKDPEGFSPLTILDKTPWKQSNFVGTPKLKFFVTKEKVIASLPPLDGFDIKNIEMIMDEKMGFPSGICVFELPNYIDAGKFKKYLNRRDVEAVSVEMNENRNPVPTKTDPRNPSRKAALKESRDRSLQDSTDYANDKHRPPSEERKEYREHEEGRGRRDHSPRFTIRVPRDHCHSPSREVRVPRGRSPSPSLEVQPPRRSSPSPLRRRISRDRARSRSPRLLSPGYQPRSRSPLHVSQVYEDSYHGSRPTRDISRCRTDRGVSPKYDDARRYPSRERSAGYRSPVPYRSPGRQSPRYRSRSPVYDVPRRRSASPRYRSHSPVRPIKPDGRGDWRYPPPDPTNFKFEPRSGLDYDPTTTLYYEAKSCCFYNDDTNEWLEYDPRSGRYVLVR